MQLWEWLIGGKKIEEFETYDRETLDCSEGMDDRNSYVKVSLMMAQEEVENFFNLLRGYISSNEQNVVRKKTSMLKV